MGFLRYDSEAMQFVGRLADYAWLSILCFICSIPIFTAGAAVSAKYYVAMKLERGEAPGVTAAFFHSFKQNFKQATIIWLVMMVVMGIAGFDMLFAYGLEGEGTGIVRAIMMAAGFFVFIACIMIFPVLARFDNTIKGTIKSGIHMTVAILPRAVLMGILYIIPPVVGLFWFASVPVVFLFGIAGPGYLSAMLYRSAFEKIENRYYEEHPEEAPETDPVEEAMQRAINVDRK